MKLQTQKDADVVNRRFSHFHDGFIKQIRVTSDNEFLTDMPWEEHRHFATNEEELRATGLCCANSNTVELEIHHYNYDWPNQPRQRAIIVQARSARIADNLLSFVGVDIFHLEFTGKASDISCSFTYHKGGNGPMPSIKDGVQAILFSASEIEVVETTWTE